MTPNTPSLSAVWSQVETLLSAGYSIIPVREKASGNYVAKSPYTGWKEYQTRQIHPKELWLQMTESFNTNAIAVICGKISGGLEVIDIDSKNKPGVDALIFQDIQKLFPDVWKRLRVHRSPSGGYHILYKVSGQPVPGNKKLATTEDKKTFLETRGEGGYVLVPPSGGYTVIKDDPIPTLEWTERCSLIALCEAYNERRKPEPATASKPPVENDYYELNPFEHFNQSGDAETVLTAHGAWSKYPRESSKFIWFTRPDTVGGGVHAAFLKDRRLYYFFTTNSQFDSERCYSPATVLSMLLHNGDKKLTYRHLVQLRYGRIKPEREQRIIARNSITGGQAPPNLSTSAAEQLKKATAEAATVYPYGIFWNYPAGEEAVSIEREALYRVSHGLGFRYDAATGNLVQVVDGFLHIRDQRYYYDTIKGYIKEAARDEICNAYEAFLQRSGSFTVTRLTLLDDGNILADGRSWCYKFYRDCWIRITANGYSRHAYPAPKWIWSNEVQPRDFVVREGGAMRDFLDKAVEYGALTEYVELVLGFLTHNYKDETTGYIPVFIEKCEDPRHGGGSGKNLLCNLLKLTTTVTSIPGVQVKYDEKFLQSWKGERVFVLSDVLPDFKYVFLKDMSTGDGKLKKLYVDETTVPASRMPKFVVLTNYSYEIVDGGLKRRIIPLEFTDFFTKCGGVDVHYGIFFPHGWTEDDWAGYDFIVLRSIQRWLSVGLKIVDRPLTESSWRKQFEHEYGKTIVGLINENWDSWTEAGKVKNDDFKKQIDTYYAENNVNRTYQPSMYKINRAVEAYGDHYDWVVEVDVKMRENGVQFKCRTFVRRTDVAPF